MPLPYILDHALVRYFECWWYLSTSFFFPISMFCRFLVEQLSKVNPSSMDRDQRLAFWINLYNALIMHVSNNMTCYFRRWLSRQGLHFYLQLETGTCFNSLNMLFISFCAMLSLNCLPVHLFIWIHQAYLAYGVPRNDIKLFSLMQKVRPQYYPLLLA